MPRNETVFFLILGIVASILLVTVLVIALRQRRTQQKNSRLDQIFVRHFRVEGVLGSSKFAGGKNLTFVFDNDDLFTQNTIEIGETFSTPEYHFDDKELSATALLTKLEKGGYLRTKKDTTNKIDSVAVKRVSISFETTASGSTVSMDFDDDREISNEKPLSLAPLAQQIRNELHEEYE